MIEGKTVQFEDGNEQQGYVQLPRHVLFDAKLSIGARLLYGALAGFAWQDESCWPGQERLASDLCTSVRTVRRWITELIDAGLISVERRGLTRSNRYVLHGMAALDRTPVSHQDRTQVAALDRTPVAYEVEVDEEEAERSNSCGGEVDEIFDHYLSAFPNKRQKKADEQQRKTIRNALTVATVDELKACIDANAASDWHQKRGAEANRPGGKHNSLSLILAPKTRGTNYPSGRSQREQIDYWLARADAGKGMGEDERNRRIEEWVEARNKFANGDGPDPGATPWEKGEQA